jgi:spore germination cell wall hydrolase CwlJ-like protein
LDDLTALALNAFNEANLEPDDGMAAVCQVVLNRTCLRYQSNGTIQGSIEWPNAFSWVSWDFVNRHYAKVAFTVAQVTARLRTLLFKDSSYKTAWERAQRIAGAVMARTYVGADFAKITPATVLYANLAISQPAWAKPANQVCVIGHHTFFHA